MISKYITQVILLKGIKIMNTAKFNNKQVETHNTNK